ncbi:GNAT family N-acetyltransferase [Carboxylicivirga sediminis]|uniref:GNAT family N-acetyltransferase n=1 Tax=Carboxylicivirga sediminis TaxID=2006564 RepID=A0A941F9C2_9BACT|nr:GNAT family N-acetyltransferase [Carboxylicivirga sediminis]MBR8537878.1 GNAT family N-acetyltransferase [Carboxylicivirga sediminis]
MQYKFKPFKELSLIELYKILQLRAEIFVVEQNCVYNDLDSNDEQAYHLMAFNNNDMVGYARILPPGSRFKEASIGRLVVHKDFRFKGLARQLMTTAADWVFEQWEVKCIQISAQKYLKAFYGSLGYQIISDEYLEDGIPHLKMELQIDRAEQ